MTITPALQGIFVPRAKPKRGIFTISDFDRLHCAILGRYIANDDITGAYNHVHQSGIYANSIKIEGMIALYNHIDTRLQIPDAIIIQESIKEKIRVIISKYLHRRQEAKKGEIHKKLHLEIFTYYKSFIEQKHYQEKTVPLPSWIYILMESLNPESPLAKDIQSITLPSCESSL